MNQRAAGRTQGAAAAGQGPPGIDELSERLSALANRIGAMNGQPAPSVPAALLKALGRQKPAEPARRAVSAAASPSRAGTPPSHPVPERDPDGRQWPRVPIPGDPRVFALEAKVADQDAELNRRHREIADLTNIQQTQANELQVAGGHIVRLTESIAGLQTAATAQDEHVAELTQRLVQSETEKVALQSQLAGAQREVNQLSLRLLNVEGILNDRTVDLAASSEIAEELRQQLTAALAATAIQVASAEERLQRRHESERKLRSQKNDRTFTELHALVAERDRRVRDLEKVCAELADCSAALSAQVTASQSELDRAMATIGSQASHIDFLDTVIKVTRDNSEATVKELIAEFDRERSQFAAKEQASSELQKNIVRLLPKLLERRARLAETAVAAQVA